MGGVKDSLIAVYLRTQKLLVSRQANRDITMDALRCATKIGQDKLP